MRSAQRACDAANRLPASESTTRRRLWRSIDVAAELLLGAACPGCAAAGFGLCPRCRSQLCEPEPHWTRPTPAPAGFPQTVTGGPYDELLHALIPAHKERQAWLLSRPLGERLARSLEMLIMEDRALLDGRGPLVLVPVPSTRAAVRNRGRDATAAIAKVAARRLRHDHRRAVTVSSLLRPARRIADQSELSESERRSNLRGAYSVRGQLRLPSPGTVRGSDPQLILVDDLVTTGSSLTEAARALRAAGLNLRGAAVVAATARRHANR